VAVAIRRGGDWFVILSGPHEGRPHLVGWMNTAIGMEGPDDPGLALAVCPRCHALVLADEGHAYGDRTWAHEQWHAATDHPIPVEYLKEDRDG